MMAFKFRFVLVITLVGLLGLILPSAALATASMCDAVAGNLVLNCGFETGAFNPEWTTMPAASGSGLFVYSDPHSGTFDAEFAATGGLNDYIYQNLATTAGTIYDVNFWVDASRGDGSNQFVANWGGVNFFSLPGVVLGGYINYDFLLPATSTSTQLEFGGQNAPDYTYLDDITVVPATTPEPSSIFLFASGLIAIGGSIKRRILA
jgi:PEP-CTERM motif-containing protein